MAKAFITFPDGRQLTQHEWWAYLKEHPDSTNEIVVWYGDFGFNVYGVCMNPHRLILHAKPGSMRYGDIASVAVAQTPGGWAFACDSSSDITSPLYKPERNPYCFDTPDEAIFAGLQQLEKKLKQDLHWVEEMEVSRRRRDGDDEDQEEKTRNNARMQRIKRLLKETREKMDYYDPRQMLLF